MVWNTLGERQTFVLFTGVFLRWLRAHFHANFLNLRIFNLSQCLLWLAFDVTGIAMCVLILEGPIAFRICQRTPIDCPADCYMIEMPKPTPKCPLVPLQERRACMLECIILFYILCLVSYMRKSWNCCCPWRCPSSETQLYVTVCRICMEIYSLCTTMDEVRYVKITWKLQ